MRARERFNAPPDSMRLVGPDEDLGEPLYDINEPVGDKTGRSRR